MPRPAVDQVSTARSLIPSRCLRRSSSQGASSPASSRRLEMLSAMCDGTQALCQRDRWMADSAWWIAASATPRSIQASTCRSRPSGPRPVRISRSDHTPQTGTHRPERSVCPGRCAFRPKHFHQLVAADSARPIDRHVPEKEPSLASRQAVLDPAPGQFDHKLAGSRRAGPHSA